MTATLRPMKPFAAVVSTLAAAAMGVFAQQAQPDPNAILKGARMSAALVDLAEGLTGNLSKDGRKTPVALFLKGKNIQFQFSTQQNRWDIFHLRLDDEALNLFRIADGKTENFPASRLVEPIAGTDVTYEDLSMRFLYWPNARIEGEENVNSFDCYKLKINKPQGVAGRYAAVYVWVSKKYGAFIKVAGYEASGKLVKEFQVRDVMPINDKIWGLKRMEVATYDPAKDGKDSERKVSITNLVFDSPRKAPKPAGLR